MREALDEKRVDALDEELLNFLESEMRLGPGSRPAALGGLEHV